MSIFTDKKKVDEEYDVASMLNSLQNNIEDLEIKVNDILVKQLQTRRELDLILEKPEMLEDETLSDDKREVQFPEDYHFTEDLEKTMENMIAGQKAWMESVQSAKNNKTGLKGLKFFDEMNKHMSDRLEYLEMSKKIIQGPLLEELPQPEEAPVEETPEEEEKEKKKNSAKKGSSKKRQK